MQWVLVISYTIGWLDMLCMSFIVGCGLFFSFHILVSLSFLICLLSLTAHPCFSSFQVRVKPKLGVSLVVLGLPEESVYRAVRVDLTLGQSVCQGCSISFDF